jgi:hypothetical protein
MISARFAVASVATVVVVMMLAMAPTTDAQQARKVWRIGLLSAGDTSGPRLNAFREGLRNLGYVGGATSRSRTAELLAGTRYCQP